MSPRRSIGRCLAGLVLVVSALSSTGTASRVGAQSQGAAPIAPTPFTQARWIDTRENTNGGPPRRLAAGETLRYNPWAGPALSGAVQLNVTVVEPSQAGYLTVFPCGDLPGTSTVNFAALDTVANAVTAPMSPSGEVCFYTTAETDLVVDFNGFPPSTNDYQPLPPVRVLDTRQDAPDRPAGKSTPGGITRVAVHGATSVPAGAAAVSINLTATEGETHGYVTAFSCGDMPWASNLNHPPLDPVANAVVVSLNSEGAFCLYSTAAVDLIVDLNGWYTDNRALTPVNLRILDTREMCRSTLGMTFYAAGATLPQRLDVEVCGETVIATVHGATMVTLVGSSIGALPMIKDFSITFPWPGGPDPAGGCARKVTISVSPSAAGPFTGTASNQSLCNPNDAFAPGPVEVEPDRLDGKLTVRLPLAWVRAHEDRVFWTASIVGTNGAPAHVIPPPSYFYMQVNPSVPGITEHTVPMGAYAAGANAVIVNLTATGSTRGGFAVASGCGGPPPTTSTVNFGPGQTRANLAVVPLSSFAPGQQSICVLGIGTHLVLDVLAVVRVPMNCGPLPQMLVPCPARP